VELKVKKLTPEAVIPTRADPGSSGWDLYAIEDTLIPAGQWRRIRTGLAMEVPIGYEIQIRPRSGLAAEHGVTVLNAPGTVDSSYRGEVQVLLYSIAKEYQVKAGQRIAQAVVMRLPEVELVEVDNLSETSRGSGGFGSTGK